MADKLRLQVMSDLHLEFYKDYGLGFIDSLDPSGVDAVALAGDILSLQYEKPARLAFAAFAKKFPKVFYVPGNHEYYKTDAPFAHANLKALTKDLGITMLRPDKAYEFKGQRLLGGTMWFPHKPQNGSYEDLMNDFFTIRRFKPWVYEQHVMFREELKKNCKPGDIVVTHHLPSGLSTPKRFIGQPLNRFFVGEMDNEIQELKPGLWIHGHTHDSFDYQLHDTRVVCNPRGYPGSYDQGRNGYKDKLIIEL